MDWYVKNAQATPLRQPPNDQDMTWTGPDVAQIGMTQPGAAALPTRHNPQPPWKRKKRRPIDTVHTPMRMDADLPPATEHPLNPDPWLQGGSSY